MKGLLFIPLSLFLVACGGSALAPLDPPAPLTELAPELKVDVLWAAEVGRGVGEYHVSLPPLVDGDRVFSVSRKGLLIAFDAVSGARKWRVELPAPIHSGPADGGEMLLFGGDAEVIAAAKADGRVVWRAPVSSEVLAAPVRAGDLLIVRTVDGGVFGLSAADGTERWRYRQEVPLLTLRGMSSPAVVGDVVVVGFANGQMVGLHLQSGQPLWQVTVAMPRGRTELDRIVDIDAAPKVYNRIVYATSYHGRTVAVTLDNGRGLWDRDVGSYAGFALDPDALYLADPRGDVWGLSRLNGGTLWRQTALHGRGLSEPVLQGDYLVVGDYEGYLHWLAREDGRLVARVRVHSPDYYFPVPLDEETDTGFPEDRRLLAAPAVQGDRVYAVDKRGALNAFRVSPGKP